MRCLACDALLTDFEATRKSKESGMFIDLCNLCYREVHSDINAIERPDLLHEEDVMDDEYE